MFFKDRKIVKDLIVRAGRGQGDAEFELAKRYESGRGVKRDLTKALGLYEDSANHGYAEAQLYLGDLYFTGAEDLFTEQNIDRDYEKAAYWYEKAIENGAELTEDIAMQLGEMYQFGEYGLQEDQKKAVSFYRKPAEGGNVDAQNALAGCYRVLEDKDNSLFWACKAAEQGGANELCSLGALYHDFGDLENALIYYKKAADKDDTFALCELGTMYLNGTGVEKDLKKAEACYSRAAALGYEEAEKALKENFNKD